MSQSGGVSYAIGPASFPITPYVVGPAGQAGYQTIQSAVNAAHAAGGGFIFVQNGTYVENLTLYPNISISGPEILSGYPGDPAACVIQGSHTPPTTGALTFNNITFLSTGDCFASSAAGSAELNFTNAGCGVTDGYFLNIPNWTGILSFWDFNPSLGTNDGGINNPTGGAQVYCYEAGVGIGTTHTMQISGTMIFNQGEIMCPVQFNTGSNASFANSIFGGTVTLANNSIVVSHHGYHSTGATPAITMSSSGNCSFYHSVINTSNNPAITGSGAGTLNLTDVSFINNSSLAGTLTLSYGTTKVGAQTVNGNLTFGAAGNKISAPAATTTTAGANSFGTVALSAGTATVNTTAVTTNSIILLSAQVLGTVAAAKALAVTARVNGTSFTITSSDNTDTSTIGWQIIN